MNNRPIITTCFAAGLLALSSCTLTDSSHSNVVVSDTPTITTLDVDAKDYDVMAKRLYESLQRNKQFRRGDVVALAPVKVDLDGSYHFDPRTFQETLQAVATEAQVLKFNFAVDALQEKNEQQTRILIQRLESMKKDEALTPEEMRVFGQLATVRYILFGRLVSQTAHQGNLTEVTYRFMWKLGDCESGNLDWAGSIAPYVKTQRR